MHPARTEFGIHWYWSPEPVPWEYVTRTPIEEPVTIQGEIQRG